MQINSTLISSSLAALVVVCLLVGPPSAEARSVQPKSSDYDQEAASAVIPSPNQLYGDELPGGDIQRRTDAQQLATQASTLTGAASPVPVYVSQYVVPEGAFSSQQESSHAGAVDFASLEGGSSSGPSQRDLKVAESYGHGHHGSSHHGGHGGHDEHHGYGHGSSGWLDMGAYTGKKGSFGWHADFPVGGKHGHGYGK